MPFSPPLIKPPLPPLRPPVAPPYRPPGPNRLPPTQTGPIYQPPDLLPTTGLDLKGVVCIYSNAPLWEPKKIRYRYPGENWQEIAGDRYTSEVTNIAGGNYFSTWQLDTTASRASVSIAEQRYTAVGCLGTGRNINFNAKPIEPGMIFQGILISVDYRLSNVFNDICFNGGVGVISQLILTYQDVRGQTQKYEWISFDMPGSYSYKVNSRYYTLRFKDITNNILPAFACQFKVFNVFNQQILSITRDVCPEVIVVPERCYFKAENERLVARVIQTLLDPPLRVEYQGHCATVWKDGIINLPPYPLQIYKECSDNPNCPPPKIRFDQKCEEKCEQCPPGTTIKVLLGNNIACVDFAGCIKKTIKYKSGCNNYDCICY